MLSLGSGTNVEVFTCSLDATQMETETKGTVLLHADELMNYDQSEEDFSHNVRGALAARGGRGRGDRGREGV